MAAGLVGRKYVLGLSDFLVAGRQLGVYIGIATLAGASEAISAIEAARHPRVQVRCLQDLHRASEAE